MIHKQMVIGILLVALGIFFIIYVMHASSPVEKAEDLLHKTGHFFQNVWDGMTGYKKEEPSKYTAKSISLFVSGVVFIVIGGILIYRVMRKS